MKNIKQPTRTCIACRQPNDKKNLLRIVKTDNGAVIDWTGKQNGRGAYICNDIKCVEKCIKYRAVSTNIQTEVYEKLKEDYLAGINQ